MYIEKREQLIITSTLYIWDKIEALSTLAWSITGMKHNGMHEGYTTFIYLSEQCTGGQVYVQVMLVYVQKEKNGEKWETV